MVLYVFIPGEVAWCQIPPNLEITGVQFQDSSGNSILEPGEKAWITVYFKNVGMQAASHVSVRLVPAIEFSSVMYNDRIDLETWAMPGYEYWVRFVVMANTNVPDQAVSLRVIVENPFGFFVPEWQVNFNTRSAATLGNVH